MLSSSPGRQGRKMPGEVRGTGDQGRRSRDRGEHESILGTSRSLRENIQPPTQGGCWRQLDDDLEVQGDFC